MNTSEGANKSGATDLGVKLVAGKELKLPTAVLALDAHPDGKTLFAACMDGGIYKVAIESGVHEMVGKHTSYASGVQYLPKADLLISAGYDGTLRWHHPTEGKPMRVAEAHKFWSWQMHGSPDEQWVASASGQYLAGGYKYEPASGAEPNVKVFNAQDGELRWAFTHVPPVLSVAFSPDNRYLAAGNLMGEVRVWDLENGKEVARWATPDFTSWGIIKSHHYIGGIFDLVFSPDGHELFVCGMGPMVDPMAGNGKQTWQRFAWSENPARKSGQINDSDSGNGLMEVLRFHPGKDSFLMAGRLAQGKWNTALFETTSGKLLHSLDTKMRVTDASWLNNGTQLALAGAVSQEKKKEGKCPDFGRIKLFDLRLSTG